MLQMIRFLFEYSLNIQTTDSIEDLSQIYQLIFSLPKLKSNELCLCGAHWYTFDELNALIFHTPNLRRLKLSHGSTDDSDIEDMLSVNLNNLIDLSLFTN
ncbi:unnamed protein product [Adineta steineri]|uniref:Uncharacterized protein n=1 Tax=Adineta steineri TaxID=433720 RepID=A0A814S4P5_9BILA|nr:unnamed protein product [Adineta steineri]CAF0858148.1 unnamed protein product [Adineta steineri]CAF1142613.1 unnamed protein product [Adineta steineri]